MPEIFATRPTRQGVVIEQEQRSLRDEIADEMGTVLAWNDRAAPYTIADRVLEIPRIAAALEYFSLASRIAPSSDSGRHGDRWDVKQAQPEG